MAPKFFIMIVIQWFSLFVHAERPLQDPPIELPTGAYTYQGRLHPTLYKKSKLFNHLEKEDAAIIKKLKADGYLCLRRTQTQTNCQMKSSQFSLPPGTSQKVSEKLKDFAIVFPSDYVVDFTHNGATTQEWMIKGPLTIGFKKLHVYRVTKDNESRVFLSFPVDEENPISFLSYIDTIHLGFTMILQGRDEEDWTLTYYFEALYEPLKVSH